MGSSDGDVGEDAVPIRNRAVLVLGLGLALLTVALLVIGMVAALLR